MFYDKDMERFLPIPLISQPPFSQECGVAATKMICDHHNARLSYSDIKKGLPLRDDGMLIYEIGSYFLKRGYQADIVTMNTHLFGLRHQNASQAELRAQIETVKKSRDPVILRTPEAIDTITAFMDAGGKMTARIPTAHMIKQQINRRRPVLIAATTQFTYNDVHVAHNQHFAVVTGYDDTTFQVNDPFWSLHEKPQRYKQSDLMYAIHANAYPSVEGASILTLKL